MLEGWDGKEEGVLRTLDPLASHGELVLVCPCVGCTDVMEWGSKTERQREGEKRREKERKGGGQRRGWDKRTNGNRHRDIISGRP